MKTLTLDINIKGYSGPFDLLCLLAEEGKFILTGIKISQLIKIYGLYLIKTCHFNVPNKEIEIKYET